MKSLARRAWNSPTLTTWTSLGVRISGVAVVLPLVLQHFASAEVAVWQLFSTIFTLILMLDLGLSPTFSRLFSYAFGGMGLEHIARMQESGRAPTARIDQADTMEIAARLFGTLRWIYPRLAFASVVLFAIGGTVALLHPISQCASPTRMWLAWGAVLGGGLVSLVGNAYGSVLQGMHEVALQRRTETIVGGVQSLSSVGVLLIGGDILSLVIAYQTWAIVGAICNRAMLMRRFAALSSAPARRDDAVVRVLWPATWRSGIGVLMSHGIIQGSGLVYAQLVPAAQLASYLVALRLMTTISQISQAPFYSKLPRLGALQAQSDRVRQLRVAQDGMRASQWVLASGIVFVAFLGDVLLRWIGSRTAFVNADTWAAMGGAFFVERFGAMHMQLYSLTNRIVWHIANGVTGVLMMAVAVLLFPRFGQLALPGAMLIAYAVFYSSYAVHLSSRAFGFRIIAFECRAGLPAGVALAVALCASVAAR